MPAETPKTRPAPWPAMKRSVVAAECAEAMEQEVWAAVVVEAVAAAAVEVVPPAVDAAALVARMEVAEEAGAKGVRTAAPAASSAARAC